MPTSRMLAKQIVATYASVLFDAADEAGAVDEIYAQLDAALRLVRGHAPLRDAMSDDAVPGVRRSAVAREVFAGLQPSLVSTIAVMVERDDFDLLSSLVDAVRRDSRRAARRGGGRRDHRRRALGLTTRVDHGKARRRSGQGRRPSGDGRSRDHRRNRHQHARAPHRRESWRRSSRVPVWCSRSHILEVKRRWRRSPPVTSMRSCGHSWTQSARVSSPARSAPSPRSATVSHASRVCVARWPASFSSSRRPTVRRSWAWL